MGWCLFSTLVTEQVVRGRFYFMHICVMRFLEWFIFVIVLVHDVSRFMRSGKMIECIYICSSPCAMQNNWPSI